MAPTRTALASAVLALSLAAGCSSKKKEETAEAAKPSESASNAPAHGGHIVLPSNEPTYLNPIIETQFNRANPLIFEGLVGLGPALEAVPRLAESWETSADGKVITFRLRKGVSWHDGEPFTARDVAFTFEAIRSAERTLWKSYFASVESLATPDDHTVVVTYAKPYAAALTAWSVGILPQHVYSDTPLSESKGNKEPVGTGPYRLVRWEEGKLLLLEANDTWWHGRPQIDTIELVVGLKNQFEALVKGELDFADIPDIQAWSTEAQMPEFRERFEVTTVPGALIRLVAWNVQRAPFDDVRVRKALTLAMNRPRFIEQVLLGQGQVPSAPFLPSALIADPSVAPHPFALDRAGALLDEAGLKAADGPRLSVTLITLESQRIPVNEEILAIYRRDLAAIGVELKVEFMSVREFLDKIIMRDFDAAFYGWLPDIPDPDPSALLHSSQIGVGQNFAGYANAEVDQLLDAASTTSNRDERRAIYHKLHAILHEQLPYTVAYAPYRLYAWNRRLRGVNPSDIGSQPRFPGIARWWVQP